MTVYVGIYLTVALFLLFYLNLTEGYRFQLKVPFYILIIFIIAITIFREGIGTDYETYFNIYITSPTFSQYFKDPFASIIEPGYSLLNVISKTLGLGFPFVSFVCVCIVIYNYYKASANFQLDFTLVFLTYLGLYFFSHNFNVIRQGIAASFIWHAFSVLTVNKGKTQSILLLLTSCLFHYISLLFIPFLWIINRNIPYKVMLGSLFFAILTVLLKIDVTTYVLDALFSWSQKYQFYKTIYYSNIGTETGYTIALGVILNLILILSLIILKARENITVTRYNVNNVLLNGFYFALLSLLLLSNNGVFAERIGGVLYVSLIFLLPLVFKAYFDKKLIRVIFSMIFILYIGLYYFKTITVMDVNNEYQYIPYRSIILDL